MVKCGNKFYIFELYKEKPANLDIFFYGTYTCKADAKGRVMLPVNLKNQMNPILNEGFVIKRSMTATCLELYPMTEWKKEIGALNSKSRHDNEVVDFIRKFTAGLRPVDVDSTGRLLISKALIDTVEISKDVVLAAIGNYIEIWDKALYDKAIETTREEAIALSKKVMLGEKEKDNVS